MKIRCVQYHSKLPGIILFSTLCILLSFNACKKKKPELKKYVPYLFVLFLMYKANKNYPYSRVSSDTYGSRRLLSESVRKMPERLPKKNSCSVSGLKYPARNSTTNPHWFIIF